MFTPTTYQLGRVRHTWLKIWSFGSPHRFTQLLANDLLRAAMGNKKERQKRLHLTLTSCAQKANSATVHWSFGAGPQTSTTKANCNVSFYILPTEQGPSYNLSVAGQFGDQTAALAHRLGMGKGHIQVSKDNLDVLVETIRRAIDLPAL